MQGTNGQHLRFAAFELDPANELLRKGGVVVKLPPQPFKVLIMLASRPGQLVRREELYRAIWGDETVDFERGLNTCMRQIRTALGEEAGSPQLIETVPRLGYRFVASVDLIAADPPKLSVELENVTGTELPLGGLTSPVAGGKEGLRRWRWWAALAFTAVFVMLAVVNVSGLRDRLRDRSSVPQIQCLAVLPLENLSRDPEQEYFANGITEAITTDLAKIGPLRVISRTSAMAFKGTHKTAPEIARELNADAVVEGTVLLSGNRVRITVQLVQAATDRHLWAETYERELRDVLALQDEVADSIANALRLKLGAGSRRYTDDVEAYQLYLRGRYALDRRTPLGGSMLNALQFFEQATARDSNYALAYAGTADTLLAIDFQHNASIASRLEAYQRAKAAAEKALELDATLSEAHTALGGVREREYAWPDAERVFRRAIELDPNNADAHLKLGSELLFVQGRSDDGLAEIRRALALDPLSFIAREYLAEALLTMGRYQEAVEEGRKATPVDPTQVTSYMATGRALSLQGKHAEAVAVLQEGDRRSGNGHFPQVWLGCAYVQAKQRDQAIRVLRNNLEAASGRRDAQNRKWLLFHACLGDKDLAFDSLEKMYAERDPVLPFWLAYPELAWLRPDHRFAALRQKLNLTPWPGRSVAP
jgi:TolB-like protein/DNA-binding winged helix-turn-helix (wHTH) protein/Tfp pilus assembly protein PilF